MKFIWEKKESMACIGSREASNLLKLFNNNNNNNTKNNNNKYWSYLNCIWLPEIHALF